MFNTFYPFTRPLLDAFIARDKKYFVRQTFQRGLERQDPGIKGCFLISHYDHLTTAMDHYGAIGYDPNRFLYDWNDPPHRKRLEAAAAGPSEYRIFSAVFRADWEKQVPDRVKEKIRMYVSGLGWKPKSGEMVDTHYEIQFGELYIRMKYAGRQAKVKFEVIEKLF